ncbi:sensor histidine kinase [Microbacterium tumbae]
MIESPHDRPRRRRLAVSVRTRIVATITAVTALGLLAVGLSVYFVERQGNLEQVDSRLHANLESARFIVAEGDATVSGSAQRQPWSSSTDALRAVVERMSPDDNTGALGMLDGKISMVPGMSLDLDLSGATDFAAFIHAQMDAGEPLIGTYAEDGVIWRYLAAPIEVADSPAPTDAVFVLVYDVKAELAEFDGAARVFALVSAIVVLVVAATGTIVATRLLRPLRHMRETALRVSAQSLEERIPVVGDDDVAELASTMNDMLDRLDDALDSQRRLLSDVGHELKTPLTIVRGHVEVMDPENAEDARETQSLVMDELDRMGRLVQDLAGAAALHGPTPVQLAPVDVADLVEQIARKARGIVGADVTVVSTAQAVALLDAGRITQAMLQLAQNATTHGGGRLEIGSRADSDRVELWVRDFGPGVPDEAKERVFDRFHRGPGSESSAGSGLGLNIVQVIARAHQGAVDVTDAPDGGAVFTLRIPRRIVDAHDRTDGLVIPPRPPLPAERM